MEPLAKVILSADASLFARGMDTAARAAESSTARIKAAFGSTQAAVAGIAGLGLTATFVSAVKHSAEFQDSMGKMAQRSGVAIEALSGLSYAAELADVSQDDLGKGLKKLSIELQGGGAKLKSMGIEATTADGAFLELADRFQKMPDGVQKTAEAAELLGEKFGPNLITLLNQGSEGLKAAAEEARRFGLIVSKEAAVAAEEFNDNLKRLEKSSQGARVALTGDLIKGLGEATRAFLEASAEGGKFAGVIAGIKTLFTGTDRHKNNVDLVELTDKLLTAENALSAARAAGMNPTGIAAREKYVSQLKEQLQTTLNYKKVLDELEKPAPKGQPAARTPDPVEIKIDPDIERGRLLAESLTLTEAHLSGDFIQKWDLLSAAYKGNAINLKQLTEAQALLLKQQPFMKAFEIGDTTDAMTRRLDSLTRGIQRQADLNAEIDKLSGRPADDRKRELTSQLEARLNAGEIFSPEELDRIVNGIGGVSQELEKARDIAGDFASVFESGFEKAILSGEKLSDVLASLGKDILQIGLRTAITQPLGKWAGNQAAGLFSTMFGFADGGIMTDAGPLPLRKYAAGGVATTPQLAMFGEGSMNEAYVPLPDGRRIPVNMKGGGGRGRPIVININNTIGSVASHSDVVSGMRTVRAQIMGELSRSQRMGGAFA